VQGIGPGGITDAKGSSKVKGCAEEGASEGVAVFDGSIDTGLGVKV
jgi:hypothetical protein